MSKEQKTLIFVYNAKSGLVSKLSDFTHKVLSPKTYACNLCSLTYNTFKPNKEWTLFLNELDYSIEFLYKDEPFGFDNIQKPIIVLEEENNLSILLNHIELSELNNSEDLIKTLKKVLDLSW